MNELLSSVIKSKKKKKSSPALMLPSATDLPGGEHMLSHEVFDLLQDGPSFERLAEQSVVRGHGDRPGSENLARYKS